MQEITNTIYFSGGSKSTSSYTEVWPLQENTNYNGYTQFTDNNAAPLEGSYTSTKSGLEIHIMAWSKNIAAVFIPGVKPPTGGYNTGATIYESNVVNMRGEVVGQFQAKVDSGTSSVKAGFAPELMSQGSGQIVNREFTAAKGKNGEEPMDVSVTTKGNDC